MTNFILENYEFGEIKEYVFFLESTIPYDKGVFFTFDSEAELLSVIKEDLLSFCYVDDLIDGLYKLMSSPDSISGPINLGNPREFTMLEIAELILKLTKSKSKLISPSTDTP